MSNKFFKVEGYLKYVFEQAGHPGWNSNDPPKDLLGQTALKYFDLKYALMSVPEGYEKVKMKRLKSKLQALYKEVERLYISRETDRVTDIIYRAGGE